MPYKIPTLKRTYRHLARYGEIISVFVKYGFGDLVASIKIPRHLPQSIQRILTPPDASVGQMSRGDRIRMALSELGPTFIKLGQFLSNRPDVLPAEFISALRELQDSVTPFDPEEAQRILEKELGKPVTTLFKDFSKDPIASASIAQVHKATLMTGECVAIKIQRPDIEQSITTDIEILFQLAGLIERQIHGAKALSPTKLCEEFERNIKRELNFRHEASHLERFAENFKNTENIHVPKLYGQFCSQRVLTTEFIVGIKVTDSAAIKAAGLDPVVIAQRGTDFFLQQVFEHGFFHGDPHAGNIFILPNNVICFIDYGIMGFLSPTLKEYLVLIMLAIAERDSKKIVRILVEESQHSVADVQRLEYDVSELLNDYLSSSVKNLDISDIVKRLTALFTYHNLRVMPGFFLLFKSLVNIEGIAYSLDPDFAIIKHIEPFAKKLVQDRLNPFSLLRSMFMSTQDIGFIAKQLPFAVKDIMDIVKNGKLRIKFEHQGLEPILNMSDQLVNRLVFAIIVGALIMGSSLVVLSGIPPKINGIPLIGIVGFITAGLFGFWLLISMIWKKKL